MRQQMGGGGPPKDWTKLNPRAVRDGPRLSKHAKRKRMMRAHARAKWDGSKHVPKWPTTDKRSRAWRKANPAATR